MYPKKDLDPSPAPAIFGRGFLKVALRGRPQESRNTVEGFAPVIHQLGGRDVIVLARVRYGERAYRPILENQFKTFDQAELAAERENKKLGLTADEAWLLIENTTMCGR